MDILIRNISEAQRAAMEKARGERKLQEWGANALLDAAKFTGNRDNLNPPRKAPGKNGQAKAPAKKRVPVRPAAKAKAPAKAPAKKSAAKAKPASSKDESWRLEPQFRDKSKKKL